MIITKGKTLLGLEKHQGCGHMVGLYAGLCRSRECINLCPCSLRYKKKKKKGREKNLYSKQEETGAMILMGKWDRKNLTCISLHSPLRHKARGSSPGITWPSGDTVLSSLLPALAGVSHGYRTNLEFPPHTCPLLNIEMNNILFPEFH